MPASTPRARCAVAASAKPTSTIVAPSRAFSWVDGSLGDHVAVVDHDDVVGEAVGLFEVLRREQHRGAFGDELLDDPPEVGAALRVETGGRLVEEEHLGPVHERGREVEPAPHAAAVGAHGAGGGVGEIEALEQLVVAGAQRLRVEVRELPDQPQVLVTGEVLVDRGVLPGETDALAHRLRIRADVDAEHLGAAAAALQDRGEDAHRGGLAGAVRAEQTEHAAGRHREVDAVERDDGSEAASARSSTTMALSMGVHLSRRYLNDVKYL